MFRLFKSNLDGYINEEAVFTFLLNSATLELEEYTLYKVLTLRSCELDESVQNKSSIVRKGCLTMRRKNIDSWVEKQTNRFLRSDGGWLILKVHGLDNEVWPPELKRINYTS